MTPTITVVICTFNNANSLAVTLQQLAAQQVSEEGSFEIVVVDNNSPDQAEMVVRPYLGSEARPMFRYLMERRQGLSYARNTGLEASRGRYILFTDDDADIPSNWVQRYLDVIADYQPDCLYSKIRVIWDQEKPWWYLPEYLPYFVGLDYGNDVFLVADHRKEFFGKNFCVRRDLLVEFGGFDPELGRIGNKLGAGEETLIFRRLLSSGRRLVYFPDAEVGHRLKPREYEAENILRLHVDGAASSYRVAKANARVLFAGRPVRLLIDAVRDLTRSALLYPVASVTGTRARRYFHYLRIRRSLSLAGMWLSGA